MVIHFRPHHFLCALCFQGRGYSPAFISNFQAIMDHLTSPNGDSAQITIVKHTDSICDPCPHRIDTTCTSEATITALDTAHANALGIKTGEVTTWGAAKNNIAQKISLDTFHQICSSCNWKTLGICENALTAFLENTK